MKRYLKLKNVFLLFVALIMLQSTLDIFLDQQFKTIMNSNHLRTVNYIEYPASLNDSVIKTEQIKGDYWKMQNVQLDYGGQIFAFDSTAYDEGIIPLYKGVFFKHSDSKEALIGRNIKTINIKNKEWLVINSCRYEVVGRIGEKYDSTVDDYILLNDKTLFDFSESGDTVILDSLNGEMLNSLLSYKGISRNNVGIERWFDISSFNKLIKLNGEVLIVFVCLLISYIFLHTRSDLNDLKYELGISRRKIFYKEIMLLCMLFIISFTIEWFYKAFFDQIKNDISNLKCITSFKYLIILLSYSILFAYRDKKGLKNV